MLSSCTVTAMQILKSLGWRQKFGLSNMGKLKIFNPCESTSCIGRGAKSLPLIYP